jgi:hypothetical protein
VAIRRRHALHVGVVAAVLVQLSFAGVFLADATMANGTYDALAAHRVAVRASVAGCSLVATGRFSNSGARICYLDASYHGYRFSSYLPSYESPVFYVDPTDPAEHMSKVTFDRGPEEITGDEVMAGALLAGATAVTVVHQVHLARARRRRRSAHGRGASR